MKFWSVGAVAVMVAQPTTVAVRGSGCDISTVRRVASDFAVRRAVPTPSKGLMTDVVIASAARTAIGSYGKSLAGVPASELGAIAAAAPRSSGPGSTRRRSTTSCSETSSTPSRRDAYMARVVGIKAGVPKEVAGVHRQPAVRHRRAGDRLGAPGDPDRRGRGRARRRRRVDEPRSVLDARARAGARGWGRPKMVDPVIGRPDRSVQSRS